MQDFQGSAEIHKLLKIGDHAEAAHIHVEFPTEPKHEAATPHETTHTEVPKQTAPIKTDLHSKTRITLKSLLVYPLIFIVAFGFFYIVLNFSSMLAQVQGFFTKPQEQVVLGSDLTEYYKWINNYYYAVSDPKLLDPNNDIDKDGLSNLDEFTMQTNPIVADSDGDGYPDGLEVMNGKNPWGVGAFTTAQKALAAKLDESLINNRISYDTSAAAGNTVSGAATTNYDLNQPGRLSIPRLNLQVPLLWPSDPSEFDTDLTKGVIHYPGTALPGQQGIIYVSGHSSDYIWKHDAMSQIFTRLNYLKPGDDIYVDVYGLDGKVQNFRYQVTGSKIYKPDDQTQFIDNSANILNLSTCWPIGTSTNRLVVSAVQVAL